MKDPLSRTEDPCPTLEATLICSSYRQERKRGCHDVVAVWGAPAEMVGSCICPSSRFSQFRRAFLRPNNCLDCRGNLAHAEWPLTRLLYHNSWDFSTKESRDVVVKMIITARQANTVQPLSPVAHQISLFAQPLVTAVRHG